MSSEAAIQVQRLGKCYQINASQERRTSYRTLREALVQGLRAALASKRTLVGKRGTPAMQDFWALRDLSFEVAPGEAVGIIGRNGAGKSTLLKLLARITEPSEGSIDLYGRVGSLLEVGTGFHPELSGRENIYLNGAILGMRRAEITRQFDAIVEFAEVGPFLDTPVKHYSSGMYVRLAFAVAAHLETEILLVDEVLAVGDAAFQKKCLGKMEGIANQGRTVLFVSHNMAAVRRLCTRAVCLHQGQVIYNGETEGGIHAYLGVMRQQFQAEFPARSDAPVFLRQMEVLDGQGHLAEGDLDTADGLRIRMVYEISRPVQGMHAFLRIHLAEGETLLSSGDADTAPERLGPRQPGRYTAEVAIPPRLLGEGIYTATWSAGVPFQANYDVQFHAVSFRVVDQKSRRAEAVHLNRPGYLGLDLPWEYR